ncbi:MAG TPA: cytochrome c [Burkholderiales bacterium]|nr:cytochrome c [Burkholderiales bacterium]
MKRNTAAVALALSAGFAFASHALAQAKPEVLVKQREAAMMLMGKYFGPLVGMARGKAPYDAAVVQRNAGYLSMLDKMPWDGFSESTKGQKSEALPAVWEEPAKFKQAQERLQNEVGKLVQVSGGDEAAVKSQIGAVGKACGGCHEHFREKH